MDIADLSTELDRLQAKVLDDMVAAAQDAQAQLRRHLESFRADSMAKAVRVPTPVHSIIPAAPRQSPDIERFGAALLEPTIAVHTGGTVLHVHRVILRGIPYFAAMLDGAWRDAVAPTIELPCSAAEFALILRRLYTGEPLGSSALPLSDCASALRVGAAAAMLLIDNRLPELASVLSSSIRTAEDAEMAAAAQHALPAALNVVITGVAKSCPLSSENVIDLITKPTTVEARAAASAILESRRGSLDVKAIAEGAKALLERGASRTDASQDVVEAARISQDYLDCETATSVFQHIVDTESVAGHNTRGCYSSHNMSQPTRVAFRVAFLAHLRRCAEQGRLAKGFALFPDAEENLLAKRRMRCDGYCGCASNAPGFNYLRLGKAHANDLGSVVRAAKSGRAPFAAEFARLPPSLLVDLLSDDVLMALGSDADPLILRLVSQPKVARKWCTTARLALLPVSLRRRLCVALLKELNNLAPEVAAAVVETIR